MYCPNCSKEVGFPDLKYCSGCGLPISALAELLTEGKRSDVVKSDSAHPIRARDINIGASLLFLSSVFGAVVAATAPGPPSSTLLVGYFATMILFFLTVFIAQFLPRGKGISIGASLMLFAALFVGLFGYAFNFSGIITFTLIANLFIALLFLSDFVRRAAEKLESRDKRALPEEELQEFLFANKKREGRLMPAMFAAAGTGTPTTSELTPPASVTERTTSLLKE